MISFSPGNRFGLAGSIVKDTRKRYIPCGRKVKARVALLATATTLSVILPPPLNGASCDGAEAKLTAANRALERGDLAGAERLFLSLKASHPRCHKVLLGLVRVRAAHGDFLAADTLSVQALSLAPDDVDALILRARILRTKGELGKAEELLAKACDLAPRNAKAHFQLGVLYSTRKHVEKAAAQFEKVILLTPRDPLAYDYLALNLEILGRMERAEWAFKKGLQANRDASSDRHLDYNYGRFLMKQNRFTEAAPHLDRAVKLAPRARGVHYERAKLNLKRNRYEEARDDAEQALRLKDPTGLTLDLQVHYLLARIYSRLGDKDSAQKYTKLAQTTAVPQSALEQMTLK